MRVVLAKSTEEAVGRVVEIISEMIQNHPASVLGLATGKTMEPVYARLSEVQKLDLSKAFFFMLDEYIGLPLTHPSSFQSYIKKHLQDPLKLQDDQFSYPPVHTPQLEVAATEYERAIHEAEGIDLQLLGIGQNGHIGFNEPGSTGDSRTRVVTLSETTMIANGKEFKPGEMPGSAFSMGIGTIKEAKAIVMLATGESKADAIKYLFNHHDDESCPATFLKSHPHFTLVLDPGAASRVNLKI
jgi:glucosamine-6-phosphate deaminase